MLIAQITDCHVTAPGTLAYGVIDTNGFFAAAVAHLNGLRPRPDLVLITGDLVDGGEPEQYAAFRDRVAALEVPFRLLPGNHDDRAALRAAFPGHEYLRTGGEFILYTVDDGAVRVIALDTVVPGRPEGRLCPRRLAWLAARLAEAPERPTLIAMHHPPIDSGIAYMDAMRCFGEAEFGALLERHPCVVRVIAGHVHRSVVAGWCGTVVQVCPSTAHQVALTLGPDDPGGSSDEPPAVALHLWRPGGVMASHLSFIGDYRSTPFSSSPGRNFLDGGP